MSQASASVVTTKRQKALLTMKGYSSNWDCTRSNEEIQDKTELEEDERSPSCLDSLRSYITKCFTGTTSGNPALQLPVPSKDVAEKHMPSQAASKIAVLRPDKTGKYPCGQCSKTFSCIDPYIFHIQECHKAETPSDLLVSHYRSNNPEVKTVDRTSTPRVDTANLHSLTTLPHTVASSVASDKTLVKALHPGCFDQIAACKQTSQTIEVADAILNNSIDAVLSIEFCFATSKGVRSCRVLVLTQSDTVRLLQVVSLSALLVHKRIVRQMRYILGDHAYEQALLMQQRRIFLPCPVYSGSPTEEILGKSEIGELVKDKEVLLEQCSPLLQSYAHLILNL
ncbi:uncharacterized protein EKO05_0005364 [Ascochyta rabiei]|uniref:uncharacterized protein n=1 Tax=Didymella rabiei TaxID=5454 RepID=UPI0022021781|nr:uncharacterized protein EKO05_0005364 [Ascochyta rabiei]UPX14893.1 hypothetical protein EKO05_0005364 [Ascochyta rabiei]